jgi:hypothetical protein
MPGRTGASWAARDVKYESENLLYVADPTSGGVFVYTYAPPAIKFVEFLTDAPVPGGECVDAAQDVFVTNVGAYSHVIFKYLHGATRPVAILSDPGGTPSSCSLDPTTGDLAVTSFRAGSQPGELAIYKLARGTPKLYSGADFESMYFCGYDNKGNLFIDGYSPANFFAFSELPKGAGALKSISLNETFEAPGGVQWDDQHVAVGDNGGGIIYQFDIRGSYGTAVGSTALKRSQLVHQFYIRMGRIIDPTGLEQGAGYVNIYDYPLGGRPTRTLGNFSSPYAAVISLGKR